MVNQNYAEPKLFSYGGDIEKELYIGFRLTDPTTKIRKPFQIRMGLNFQKRKSDRLELGKGLCLLVKTALENNWNPFEEQFQVFLDRTSDLEPDINQKSLIEAIDFSLENGTWAKKTKLGYNCTTDYFKKAAKQLGLENAPIQKFTKQHVM